MVRKNNYTIEEYSLRTEDGYHLIIHHMPNGEKNCLERTPVFLMHGLYSSAGVWLILGPGISLGYLLVDECFDVWLGNSRGSYYSVNPMDVKDKDFWKFSYHEIGYYDVPAMIDFDTISPFTIHEPGGGSIWELYQHLENHNAKNFRQFDHGMMRNIDLYGELQPPQYNLTKVDAPVRIFYSEKDKIAAKEDVLTLSNDISNLIAVTAVPKKNFSHGDFVYANDAKEIVNNDVIAFLKNNRNHVSLPTPNPTYDSTPTPTPTGKI
ncbi:lipase 1-like [Arctopsyche grandis]|uniref:lipase 1-like n=1 Tax=Arctopsyche grandis TaxID=121162 RepID=UPI00406D6A99